MRILIPIATFEVGGDFRVLSELANHWMRQGHALSTAVAPTAPRTAFAGSGSMRSVYLGMLRALTRVGSHYDVILANHSFTALSVAFARTGSARKWYYVLAYEPEYYSFEPGWKGRVLQAMTALSTGCQ